MTDQPPAHQTTAELLARAQQLFAQADQELTRGLGRNVDEDHMSRLYRANLLFTGASAGARIAQAMNGAAHLDMLREFEERVDARAENGQAAFPCPYCEYVADSQRRLGSHLVAVHADDDSRPLSTPPTPSGPLSRDEIVEAIEQGARKRRNMTARELLLAYHAGELSEPGQVADLLVLADLLAPDDPLLAGRSLYVPPTLTGPYDPDRTYDR